MVASLPKLESIFDCEKITKGAKADGTAMWKCHHCGDSFVGNNATKAILHVLRIKGQQNIRGCTAEIPSIVSRRYEALYSKQNSSRLLKDEVSLSRERMLADRHERVAAFVRPLRKNSKSPPPSSKRDRDSTPVSVSNSTITSSLSKPGKLKKLRKRQSFLYADALDSTSENRLDVAIADFIHSNSLAFRLSR